LLIQYGADLEHKTIDKLTPLMMASEVSFLWSLD